MKMMRTKNAMKVQYGKPIGAIFNNLIYIQFNIYIDVFFFQAEDGIRDVERSRGLGDVYKRQELNEYIRIKLNGYKKIKLNKHRNIKLNGFKN